MLPIGGVVPFSTIDYPGALSAVVFLQGCPWRCSYCHNPHLQPKTVIGAMSWQTFLGFLERRIGLLDAVTFSGGEPTLHPALGRALDEMRRRGFRTALHTAGIYPRRLAQVLGKVDWVGLDIKARYGDYFRVTGRRAGARAAKESLALLLSSGVAYEVRTTYHPSLFDERSLLGLGADLQQRGVRRFALQLVSGNAASECFAAPALPGPAVLEELRGRFDSFLVRSAFGDPNPMSLLAEGACPDSSQGTRPPLAASAARRRGPAPAPLPPSR